MVSPTTFTPTFIRSDKLGIAGIYDYDTISHSYLLNLLGTLYIRLIFKHHFSRLGLVPLGELSRSAICDG